MIDKLKIMVEGAAFIVFGCLRYCIGGDPDLLLTVGFVALVIGVCIKEDPK